MMNNPLVSVIIPVYRVEQYLHRCVDSVLAQTLKEIEVILVDDGSPDGCPRICDEYARQDPRVRVIHQRNGGLSSARNAGIHIATGTYIGFVDSDDYVARWMYARMLEMAVEHDVDFVMTDYIRVCDNVLYHKTINLADGYYDKSKIRQVIYPNLVMGKNLEYGPFRSVCRCLYRKNFINYNMLCFDTDVRYAEDHIFNIRVGFYAGSLYYIKDLAPYFYCQHQGTITTSYNPDAWDVSLHSLQKLHKYIQDVSDYDFSRQLNLYVIYYACHSLSKLSLVKMHFEQRYREVKRIVCSDELVEAFHRLRLPALPWKFYLSILLLKYRQVWLLAMKNQLKARRIMP